jgi:hypothetical protein
MCCARFGRWQAVSWLLGAGLLALLLAGGCRFPSYTFQEPADAADVPDACSGPDCGLVCTPGYADCNGKVDDGCETTLGTSSDCGECGAECSNPHGVTHCTATSATGTTFTVGSVECRPTCATGFADCDLKPDNGCETDLNSDTLNCSACGKPCSANGGTPSCVAGVCGVSSCNPGFGDCSNSGVCNSNLNTDPLNCGRCGHVCSNAHGAPFCNGGICQATCDAGYGDCNGAAATEAPPDDGCETKLNVPDNSGNVPNCGACGAACARRAFTTVNVDQCALGMCARDCFAGMADCDDNRNSPGCVGSGCGCESLGSTSNCGTCGHSCLGGACADHGCECPDAKPKSGSTKCTLASNVTCGDYPTGCHCVCKSGLFQCTDGAGKAC